MTTLNGARAAVYARCLIEWRQDVEDVASPPLTPYCFDNEPFDPPKLEDGRGAPWARFSVRTMPGGQETLGRPGNRKYRRRALARAEIYGTPGTGMEELDLLAQQALAMFEGRSLLGTTVKLFDAQIAEVGLVDEGRWFLSTVQASFDYEQIK